MILQIARLPALRIAAISSTASSRRGARARAVERRRVPAQFQAARPRSSRSSPRAGRGHRRRSFDPRPASRSSPGRRARRGRVRLFARTESARALVETAATPSPPPVELSESEPVGRDDHRLVARGAMRGGERRQQLLETRTPVTKHRCDVGAGEVGFSRPHQPTERDSERAVRATERVLVVSSGKRDPPAFGGVDTLHRGAVYGQARERGLHGTAQPGGHIRPEGYTEERFHAEPRSVDISGLCCSSARAPEELSQLRAADRARERAARAEGGSCGRWSTPAARRRNAPVHARGRGGSRACAIATACMPGFRLGASPG